MDILTKGKSQYTHGGTPQVDLARFGMTERTVLDFSANLNFLGPPAIIKEKWEGIFDIIKYYPSIEGTGVTYYYRKKFGISSRNFLAGNGSTEMIYLVPRALRFRRVVVITPSYHDYERASMIAGAKVVRRPLFPENEFAFPGVGDFIEVLEDADALWLGRPNNPTGTLFAKESVLELAGLFPEKWFIIDEAFIQFLNGWEEKSLLIGQTRANILVIHSLTKFYAIAGLRIGGIMGDGEVISRLREEKEPWTINGAADRIAPLLLECIDYEKETQSVIKKERKRIFRLLDALDGITPLPPSANFILCKWTRTNNMDDLMRYLLLNGAYVRDCRNFCGLENNFFRIGLRSPDENDQLVSLLSSF